MNSKVKGVIQKLGNKDFDNAIKRQSDYNKFAAIAQREEDEKLKSEDQKIHEKHVRQMKKLAVAPSITVVPAKKEVVKPGLQFEGALRTLAAKYKTLDEITRHLSLGQLAKYYTEGRKMFRIKDNVLVYDEESGECYE